jgi:hypothetical protein
MPGSPVHRCTAGRVYDCPIGFYNPLEGQTDAAACERCPSNSNTRSVRSASISDCLCDANFYDSNVSDAAVECVMCPVGSDCARGSTLERLPLRKGYYRLDSTSVDVRVCPDAQVNCSTTFGTSECHSASGCQGGTGYPCANGLEGVYCQLCNRSSDAVFYKAASATKAAKCEPCSNTVVRTALPIVAVVVAAALALKVKQVALLRLSSSTVARLRDILIRYTPSNKLKIVFVFYQIATRVPRVYGVAFPPNVVDTLETFATIVTLGLDNVAMAPLECMRLHGYVPRLLFWMTLPVVLTLCVLVYVVLASGWRPLVCGELARVQVFRRTISRRRSFSRDSSKRSMSRRGSHEETNHGKSLLFHLQSFEEKQRQQNVFEKALHSVLLIMFFLYPTVTNG